MKRKDKKTQKEVTTSELFESLINDYISIKQNMIQQVRRGMVDKITFLSDVRKHIETYFDASNESIDDALTKFEQYIFGYSYLTPLINDKIISDIRCLEYNNVRVKEKGIRKETEVQFSNETEYKNFVNFVATKNQVSLSNLNAIQVFSDSRSNEDFILRFTATVPPVNANEAPYLHIRKVPKDFPEIPDLIKEDMLTEDLAKLLVQRFRTGSTLICGGNSAGKTTLLNALKETLPHDMSVMVTQQTDELTTKTHPDMMFLHSIPKNNESEVFYDLENISIAGLTMDVDFFITGEIKGREATHILNAVYTGQLCAATIHAPSADKAIDKVVDYALDESRYTKKELMKMLTSFNTVVFMKKYKVEQVYEVTRFNPATEEIEYRTIYERSVNDGYCGDA